MGKTKTRKPLKGLTFEDVWEALMETRDRQEKETRERKEAQRESQKKFDEQMEESRKESRKKDEQMAESQKESQKKFDERMAESQKNFEDQMKESRKEFDKRFGDLTNRFGEIVEYMVAPNLLEKFREFGLNFLTASSNFKVRDPENNIFFEIDIKLDNSDKTMLVEVKTKLTVEDVQGHANRMEKMRLYNTIHGHKRTLLGAVAGVVIKPNVKKYALEQGFYVIEPSGETFAITPPPNVKAA